MFGPQIKIRGDDGISILLQPPKKVDFINTQQEHSMLSIRMGEKKYLGMSREDLEEYYEKKRITDDWILWGIYINKDEFIGVVSIFHIDHRNSTAEYGYRILKKDHWGKGIISTVHFGTLLYAANFLNTYTLAAWAYEYNEASFKSLLKHGFYQYGATPKQHFVNGNWHGSVCLLWTNPNRVDLFYPEGLPSEYNESMVKAQNSLKLAKENVEIL